ncbi:hypothetical protein ABBQ38_003824 [Trebouxia sp. C0009 RCD-2024]
MAAHQNAALQQRLGPPANKYIPEKKPLGATGWVRRKWFQYQITIGTYCFDWWERLLVHLLLLTVIALVVYGAYKQVLLVFSLYQWWWQHAVTSNGDVGVTPT